VLPPQVPALQGIASGCRKSAHEKVDAPEKAREGWRGGGEEGPLLSLRGGGEVRDACPVSRVSEPPGVYRRAHGDSDKRSLVQYEARSEEVARRTSEKLPCLCDTCRSKMTQPALLAPVTRRDALPCPVHCEILHT
jgi:hypothetical protein